MTQVYRKIGRARALLNDSEALLKYATTPALPITNEALTDRIQRSIDQASAAIRELEGARQLLTPVTGIDLRD